MRKLFIYKLFTALLVISLHSTLASATIAELTIEEKVGQMLMVHFQGACGNSDAKLLIEDVHVGGFILYTWANGLDSPKQAYLLTQDLQKLASGTKSKIPLFIAVDQEGGVVRRLCNGFTNVPGCSSIGNSGVPSLAESCAAIIGRELRACGINMNFAPVVDIFSNPANSMMKFRSFGSTPELCQEYGYMAIQGFNNACVISCLKHFPGHGDVAIDSHLGLPVLQKERAALYRNELQPYKALAPSVDMIMTAHILTPALDPDNCATLSKLTLDILREEMSFEGIIISDSLCMKGLQASCPSEDEAVIRAVNAGCDILLLGGRSLNGSDQFEFSPRDIIHIHSVLVKAIKDGTLSEVRVDQSVSRILALKAKYSIDFWKTLSMPADSLVTIESQGVVDRIALLNLQNQVHLALKVLTERHRSSNFLKFIQLDELKTIGDKIWKNECGNKIEKLTFWNEREPFPSFGIGHFIWIPEGEASLFQESFPRLLSFMEDLGIAVPSWLNAKDFPWTSRAHFYEQFDSKEMNELRQFLVETKDIQTCYILRDLEELQPKLVANLASEQKDRALAAFNRLAGTPKGLFALIDYLNFKGSGLSSQECYHGKGWGLVQVLLQTLPTADDCVADFICAAKRVLKQRTANSPPEKCEERWLKGWFARLDGYL